jgi:Outer membrane protein beta-barrel domain
MQLLKFNFAAICALFILSFSQLNAQMYTKGQQDLHLGVGLGTTLYGSGYRSILPPLNVSYEKGITDNIGVGGYIGYATSRYNYDGFNDLDYNWRYTNIILGARAAYHYDLFKKPKLDTYAGAMLGFNIARARFRSDNPLLNDNDYTSPSSGGLIWSGYIGARYQFKEKLGAYAELGYGVAWLNLGLRFKL